MSSTPFSESRDFSWNIEKLVSKTMSFTYYIGEGPLYWFRIEWAPVGPDCITYPCQEIVPTISYIAPNCPYEIVENCIIMGPTCDCTIPCEPGECVSTTKEIWHMLATSVTHLCERINQECCNSKPTGRMISVKQYMRPALCCDVAKFGAEDEYVEVDFLNCECGNLIHPCIGTIIYPCHINRCGIFGPAYDGGPVPPISEIKMAPDILGHMPIAIQSVSTQPELQIVAPKQPKNLIKYGTSIPEIIHCTYNKNKLDLFYNKETNSWYGSHIFKDLKIAIEWMPLQNYNKNYKVNLSLEKKGKKSKISLSIKNDTFLEKNNFQIKFNCNLSNLHSNKLILNSKVIADGLNVFKSGNLDLQLRG